jgi:hypothetical protein
MPGGWLQAALRTRTTHRLVLAVGLALLGLTLPPPLDGLLSGDALLAAPAPPLWSRSRYMQTVDTDRLYDLGCDLGDSVDRGVRPADALVILAYGMPINFGGGSYGASLFSGPDQKTKPLRSSAQAFAHGFWACSAGNGAKLTLAMGTSNYGPNVTFDHGAAWAGMVNAANDRLKSQGWSSQAVIVGAIDLELSWSSPSVGDRWLDGYDSKNKWRVINFGDAAGCPPASSSCGTSAHPEWDSHDVWWTAWGHPSVFPVPQIYLNSGIQADQWHEIAHHGLSHDQSLMLLSGALTQMNACKERGCDPSTDNTPNQGWTQLWDAVNDGDGTDQGLRWSTDMQWAN